VPAVDLFAPSDPAFVAWPYDAYDELRRGPRVQYDERTDRWLVSRHADVDALLRDRRLGRSYLHVASHAEMGRPRSRRSTRPSGG
jgi:cytochrome P450